jgi:hypothetical protein
VTIADGGEWVSLTMHVPPPGRSPLARRTAAFARCKAHRRGYNPTVVSRLETEEDNGVQQKWFAPPPG